MIPAGIKRKRLFNAALAYRGESKDAWADQQDVHVTHLTRVLNQDRDSHRLIGEVDKTIWSFLIDVCKDYKRMATQ